MAKISFGWHINTGPDDAQTTAEQLRDDDEHSPRRWLARSTPSGRPNT